MTSADLPQQNLNTNSINTSTLDRRYKRRSRTSDTLLATVTALLKVLGVNTSSSKSNRKKRILQTAGDDTKNIPNNSKINNQTDTTTMPAMSNASISLSENDYSELKKEALMSPTALNNTTTAAAVPPTSTTETSNEVTNNTGSGAVTTKKGNAVDNKTKHITNGVYSSGTTTQTTTTGSNSTPIPNNIVTKRSANDFRFGKSIGEGSFSTVYLAKDIHTHKEYAIKVCEKQQIIRERKQEYIKREREVMNTMTGIPGFVNLYCTFQDTKNLYFVMTYAKNGDLLPHINKVGSFDSICTRFYVAEIVLALENMHKNNIVHRDLKPENILLDDKMHVLIADFGSAKILTPNNVSDDQDERSNGLKNDNVHRERKNSFVGTAQYVSPETLRGKPITKLCDLWALGCIIYQMVSGLPPFRASTEYMIFQNILKLELTFPDGFDRDAKDLVERLLCIEPTSRLGGEDLNDKYDSIRSHPFFDGINWDTIQTQTPPHIYPYLPGLRPDDELRSQYRVPDHLEPGFDDKQLTRLLGLELGTSQAEKLKNEPKNLSQISKLEKNRRIEIQKLDKWHPFTDGELILKNGYVNKRKGLFARKRMLLLTTGPRLIYIDPVQMVKKGEIPWSQELRVEPKNFKIFFVHTPNRTYYLEDPEGYALHWCHTIEKVREERYGQKS